MALSLGAMSDRLAKRVLELFDGGSSAPEASTTEIEVTAEDFKPTSFDVAMLGESAIEEIRRRLEARAESESASESDSLSGWGV